MLRIYRQELRIIAAPMLFLFLLLSFRLFAEHVPVGNDITTINVHRTSFIFSIFLKDSEEKEDKELPSVTHSVPLLDLASHISCLQDLHKHTYSMLTHGLLPTPENHPTTLHCLLLI